MCLNPPNANSSNNHNRQNNTNNSHHYHHHNIIMTTSSSSSEPVQNLTLCIGIMTLSGFLRVVATMVLAFPDHLKKKRQQAEHVNQEYNNNNNNCCNVMLVLLHILLLLIAAVASIVGTIYGPVSIAVPVQTGSQLLFNVIAMILLKMRLFDKAQRVGTYVVVFSVLSLIDVGPKPQNNQNVMELLSEKDALVWSAMITISMLVAAIGTIPLLGSSTTSTIFERLSFVTLTVGVTMSNVGMATAGKTLGILLGRNFYFALAYYIVAALLGLLFSIISATRCDQGIFTPLSSVALILINMLTGIVIWEDYKVVDTWVGYISACLLMSCGVYLLAEVDVLEQYWKRKYATDLGMMVVEEETPQDAASASLEQQQQPRISKNPSDVWHDAIMTETSSLVHNQPPMYHLT